MNTTSFLQRRNESIQDLMEEIMRHFGDERGQNVRKMKNFVNLQFMAKSANEVYSAGNRNKILKKMKRNFSKTIKKLLEEIQPVPMEKIRFQQRLRP